MAPVIVPPETEVNRDLNASVTFLQPHFDIPASVHFIVIPTGANIVIPGTALAVAANNIVSIVSKIATAKGSLIQIQASGDGDGVYYFYKNTVLTMRFMTNFNSPNVLFDFSVPLDIEPGDDIEIKVENTSGVTCDYTAAFIGVLV